MKKTPAQVVVDVLVIVSILVLSWVGVGAACGAFMATVQHFYRLLS